MSATTDRSLSKVPEVTLLFWIIKIAATTLGETGGDALSMSMNLGYLSDRIFSVVSCRRGRQSRESFPSFLSDDDCPTTTVGTTLADFADSFRSHRYARSSLLLACARLLCLVPPLGSVRDTCVARCRNFDLGHTVPLTLAPRSGTAATTPARLLGRLRVRAAAFTVLRSSGLIFHYTCRGCVRAPGRWAVLGISRQPRDARTRSHR